MKKFICMLLIFCISAALFSCTQNEQKTESDKAETESSPIETAKESETDIDTEAETEPVQTAVEADYIMPDDLPEVDDELNLYAKGILWSAGKNSYSEGDKIPLSVVVNYVELMVIGGLDNVYHDEYLKYQNPNSYTIDLPIELFNEIAANRFAFDIDYDVSEKISDDGATINLSRQVRDNGAFPVIKDVIRNEDSTTLVCDVVTPLYVNGDYSHASGGYKYLYSLNVTLRPAPDGGYTFVSYETELPSSVE